MPTISAPPPLSSQQLSEIRGPEDDWSGLRDRVERRRIQTRLNVRAHRRRKALEARTRAGGDGNGNEARVTTSVTSSKGNGNDENDNDNDDAVAIIPPPCQRRQEDACVGIIVARLFNPAAIRHTLSRDHLIPLIHYNILRATMTNVHLLQAASIVPAACISAFGSMPLFPHTFAPGAVPPTLVPTPLQRRTPHMGWIDVLPHPRLRDNILTLLPDQQAQLRLLVELNGYDGLEEEDDGGSEDWKVRTAWLQRPAMMAWDTPWMIEGFELDERFVKRWARVLDGCGDVVRATNRWREMRGEDPIVVEIGA